LDSVPPSAFSLKGHGVKYHEYNPHLILQDTVKCFWIHEGDLCLDTEQDITPDGCVELIFNFGSPYLLRTTTPPSALPVAIIVGFQNKTIQYVIGTSPKTFARTLRFQEAQRRLMFEPDADLTGLAYECGYFDQAHFIKDFKAFAGRTPSEYAQEMQKMQEILSSKDVVFLQSSTAPDVQE